jgi:hypothetical protein
VETVPKPKVKQSKIQSLEVKSQIELVEEVVKIADLEVGTEPLVVVQVEIIKNIVE